MKTIFVLIISLFLLVVASFTAFSQTGNNFKSEVFNINGVAIRGYDAVAFFTENKPVLGSKSFSYTWKGVSWQFASESNLNLFKASPEKYLPQYGGYCAYGTADGHKAKTEVDTWTIVDDKLYFNYNQNVKKLWLKNQKALIDSADRKWNWVKTME
jgi:YHS domain-containing protein